jgi:hypothetical protein
MIVIISANEFARQVTAHDPADQRADPEWCLGPLFAGGLASLASTRGRSGVGSFSSFSLFESMFLLMV